MFTYFLLLLLLLFLLLLLLLLLFLLLQLKISPWTLIFFDFNDLPHFSHPLPRPPTHPFSLYYRLQAEKESSLPPLPSPYPLTLTPPKHY